MTTDRLNQPIQRGDIIVTAEGQHKFSIGKVLEVHDTHFKYIKPWGRVSIKYAMHGVIVLQSLRTYDNEDIIRVEEAFSKLITEKDNV